MDVQDATAALKGMLGIGGISKTPRDAGGPVAVSTAVSTGAATTTTSTTNTTTDTATGSPDPNPTGIISTTTTHNNNPNNNNMASPSKKKKKKKSKPPKTPSSNPTTTGKKNNHNNNKPEVFAWSAFQSSPDASKLPIPEFSPQNTTNIYHANPSTFIVDADDAGPTTSTTRTSRTSTVTDAPKGTLSPSSSLAAPPAAPSLDSTTATSSPPQPSPSILKPEDETLTSSTGINLAAKLKTAASTTPPSTVTILPATAEATTHLPHVPPAYAMQYNYDYNTSVGDGGVGGGSPHMASPPPSLLFPPHAHQQPYQQQHQQQQQYAFVSVQVPPLHMMNPQRTLLVNTPAGPLPIVIPPHYPPGSWIQVPVVQPAYPQSQQPQAPPPYPYSSMMP
jgi:hypothetical protein